MRQAQALQRRDRVGQQAYRKTRIAAAPIRVDPQTPELRARETGADIAASGEDATFVLGEDIADEGADVVAAEDRRRKTFDDAVDARYRNGPAGEVDV